MINGLNSDKEMERIQKAQKDYEQMLKESINIVTTGLKLQTDSKLDFKDFYLIGSLNKPEVWQSFNSSNPLLPVHMSVIWYYSEVNIGKVKKSGRENYFFALLTLNKEFPHTLVYRETLAEKISDLFNNAELDFEQHKKFSNKFYTLSKDKERLYDLLNSKPLDELSKYSNMEIEIKNNLCLMRHSRKPVSKTEAIAFCEFVKDVNRIIN
jgi:hypothetical protein